MNDRIEMNKIKGMIFLVMFLLLIIQSIITKAQNISSPFYKGIQSSYGTINFQTQSEIKDLDAQAAVLAGGQIGIQFGSRTLRTSIGLLGYYSSTNNFRGTVDLYKNYVNAVFFPFELFRSSTIVQPYLTSGFSYDRYKFYGHYLTNDPPQPINYSKIETPSLGAIRQLNLWSGPGIMVKILERDDFVQFFAEALYGNSLVNAPDAPFEETSINKNIQFNVGLTFGARR